MSFSPVYPICQHMLGPILLWGHQAFYRSQETNINSTRKREKTPNLKRFDFLFGSHTRDPQFSAGIKNTAIPDFLTPKNTKFKIFTPKHTIKFIFLLTPGWKFWHRWCRWQISGVFATSGSHVTVPVKARFWNPPNLLEGMICEQTLTWCRASKLVSICFSHHILKASKPHTDCNVMQNIMKLCPSIVIIWLESTEQQTISICRPYKLA